MTQRRESEDSAHVRAPGEGIPCCTNCGRPYVKGQYYCQHCGTAVGNITPYVPYVNIPFNWGPFTDFWGILKGRKDASPGMYVLCLVVGLVLLPTLIIALPFLLIELFRNRKRRQEAEDRSADETTDELTSEEE